MIEEQNPGLRIHTAPDTLLDGALHRSQLPPSRKAGAIVPIALLAGALAGALITVALVGRGDDALPPVAATLPAAAAETQLVRFVIHAPNAQDVRLAGTWNSWSAEGQRLQAGPDGVHYTTLALPPGRHEYQFIVDGAWQADPAAALSDDDGFGQRNSVLIL